MATLIPQSVLDGHRARNADHVVAKLIQASFPDSVRAWYHPESADRPRFLILGPQVGVIALEVFDWNAVDVEKAGPRTVRLAVGQELDLVGEIGRRTESIRKRLADANSPIPVCAGVAFPYLTDADVRELALDRYLRGVRLATKANFKANDSTTLHPNGSASLDDATVSRARACLYPESDFSRQRLRRDGGRARRVALRVQLDAEQDDLAHEFGSGDTFVTGPSGSGKSLVLCARARALRTDHPDWTIRMFCYNRTLVRFLTEMLAEATPTIQVSTFHSWLREIGLRLPFFGANDADERLRAEVLRALRNETAKGALDAALIDEGQDFEPAWIQLVQQAVRPDRGGVVIALDHAQALYRNSSDLEQLAMREKRDVHLKRSYRCTKQIGHFALEAVFGNSVDMVARERPGIVPFCPEFIAEGPPVRLVWAERWDQQADFVVHEIARLVQSKQAAWKDIAVLYTQRSGMARRLKTALDNAEVPHFWVNADGQARDLFDLSENTVKLVTVHSGKGLEFPIVFLFGVEALKVPEHLCGDDAEGAQRARLAYVGMTRAQDQLYVTYTRSNPILERALKLGSYCEFLNWPDDFEG